MFLRLIPDLRRLNRWSAVSFRYAEAPIWSLKKHPALTATPVVARFSAANSRANEFVFAPVQQGQRAEASPNLFPSAPKLSNASGVSI
jgi:hypothetical protein